MGIRQKKRNGIGCSAHGETEGYKVQGVRHGAERMGHGAEAAFGIRRSAFG